MHKLFTVCTEQVTSPYTEPAASGLSNPTHLEGEVRFDQAQDQQVVTTRSPRKVAHGPIGEIKLSYLIVTCGFWFLKMHSLTMADELRSFQFLDIKKYTVNRPMPFRALVRHDVSVPYQT